MKNSTLTCLLAAMAFSMIGCGSKGSSGSDPVVEDYPPSLLTTFLDWSPVLSNDAAFASTGHSGQIVRVYFNETAKPYFTGEKELPFAPGSMVAKAVVASLETPASQANKVYFMLKKDSGFDTEHNDWSYSFALPANGALAFDSATGKNPSCSGCHGDEKEFDYVRTVEYYKKQSAS